MARTWLIIAGLRSVTLCYVTPAGTFPGSNLVFDGGMAEGRCRTTAGRCSKGQGGGL